MITIIDKNQNKVAQFEYNSTGEGIVISHNGQRFYQFKSKGTKHQNSKVKTLNPVDEEMMRSVKEFAENFVTEARLQQGIEVMKSEMQLEPIPANTGSFIKWVTGDVFKEEQENILTNNLDPKKVAREIGTLARVWYLENI
jgi:hypothetical protein